MPSIPPTCPPLLIASSANPSTRPTKPTTRIEPLLHSSSLASGTTTATSSGASFHSIRSLRPYIGTPTTTSSTSTQDSDYRTPTATSSTQSDDYRTPTTTDSIQGGNSNTSSGSPRVPKIVAVMGPTGAGKSNFIKAATGADVEVGYGLGSCTKEFKKFRVLSTVQQGRDTDIVLVDTPGFNDTYKSEADILKGTADWLLKTYQNGTKVSGVLYLHPITENRMTKSSLRILDTFKRICGSDAFPIITFITTHWDQIDEEEIHGNPEDLRQNEEQPCEQLYPREKDLRNNYWKTFTDGGSKMMRFHNTPESARSIIDSLFLDERVLLIQQEMGDQHKLLSETTAGRPLFSWLGRTVQSFRAAIQRLGIIIRAISASPDRDNNGERVRVLEAARNMMSAGLRDVESQLSRIFRPDPIRPENRPRTRRRRTNLLTRLSVETPERDG